MTAAAAEPPRTSPCPPTIPRPPPGPAPRSRTKTAGPSPSMPGRPRDLIDTVRRARVEGQPLLALPPGRLRPRCGLRHARRRLPRSARRPRHGAHPEPAARRRLAAGVRADDLGHRPALRRGAAAEPALGLHQRGQGRRRRLPQPDRPRLFVERRAGLPCRRLRRGAAQLLQPGAGGRHEHGHQLGQGLRGGARRAARPGRRAAHALSVQPQRRRDRRRAGLVPGAAGRRRGRSPDLRVEPQPPGERAEDRRRAAAESRCSARRSNTWTASCAAPS